LFFSYWRNYSGINRDPRQWPSGLPDLLRRMFHGKGKEIEKHLQGDKTVTFFSSAGISYFSLKKL